MGAEFRLGRWLVEPSLNTVSRNGASIHLEPKVMEVLVCLARRPGEAIPKDQLLQTVWPETFVTDDVLIRSISELRRVFEDDARDPQIIQTIPKRGYRLVAAVDANSPAASVTRDSIAVLPFINMSADAENEFFADGITEEIINALAQIKELHVVARSSAFSFKGKHVDPRTVGEQLNVRTVLEGSVRKAGTRLRITAQLVSAADGYHLWSERYDREMQDIFQIQDEIARSIAERLTITLKGGEQESLVKAPTKNLEAYQLYLKGRSLLYRRGGAIPYAVECLKKAVDLDSKYALAWAGLADSYTTLGYYGLAAPSECMPKGMEAARYAVSLDPSLAEAHNALAMACWMGTWNKAEAEREFLRALELNPKYIQARDWYALFYLQFSEGRLAEGVAQAKLALDADPLSSYTNAIYGLACAVAGNSKEAVKTCRRAVELDAESYLARMILQYVLQLGTQHEEASAVAESALAMSGRHSWSMAILAIALADQGKPGDADAVYAEMLARARRRYMPPALLALAASAADREGNAIDHAREALAIRDPACQPFFSKYVPFNAKLRTYRRFQELLSEVGFE
jgi:TolB-like protein/Tfp pilus assembly protein PilF